ncbi:MAG: hypothetical protein SF028_08430 [Candidatus Sumerlaeia bacterium]|nr:hypothetical protein [Candidatus Sumerlaeia bacterium]
MSAVILVFSMIWCTGVFNGYLRVRAEQDPSSAMPMLLMFAVGLLVVLWAWYLAVGRFFWKARRKRRTLYAVTDRRIPSVVAGRSPEIRAEFVRSLGVIDKEPVGKTHGNVIFGPRQAAQVNVANTGMEWFFWAARGGPIAFYDIPDWQQVHRMVVEAVDAAR